MGGACRNMGERRGVYRILVGKPEGKRPLGRPRRRWEDNIKRKRKIFGVKRDGVKREWGQGDDVLVWRAHSLERLHQIPYFFLKIEASRLPEMFVL